MLKRAALLSVLLPWDLACFAGDPNTGVPSPQGRQIMLYFNQPIGGSGSSRTYGLRIDQGSMPTPLPGAASTAGMVNHREIVNLQFNAHANVRLDFARRLSWDFGRRQFNLSGDQSDIALRLPSRALGNSGAARPAP
jgi:hypothetical protein